LSVRHRADIKNKLAEIDDLPAFFDYAGRTQLKFTEGSAASDSSLLLWQPNETSGRQRSRNFY
jgi:hypothetical protein